MLAEGLRGRDEGVLLSPRRSPTTIALTKAQRRACFARRRPRPSASFGAGNCRRRLGARARDARAVAARIETFHLLRSRAPRHAPAGRAGCAAPRRGTAGNRGHPVGATAEPCRPRYRFFNDCARSGPQTGRESSKHLKPSRGGPAAERGAAAVPCAARGREKSTPPRRLLAFPQTHSHKNAPSVPCLVRASRVGTNQPWPKRRIPRRRRARARSVRRAPPSSRRSPRRPRTCPPARPSGRTPCARPASRGFRGPRRVVQRAAALPRLPRGYSADGSRRGRDVWYSEEGQESRRNRLGVGRAAPAGAGAGESEEGSRHRAAGARRGYSEGGTTPVRGSFARRRGGTTPRPRAGAIRRGPEGRDDAAVAASGGRPRREVRDDAAVRRAGPSSGSSSRASATTARASTARSPTRRSGGCSSAATSSGRRTSTSAPRTARCCWARPRSARSTRTRRPRRTRFRGGVSTSGAGSRRRRRGALREPFRGANAARRRSKTVVASSDPRADVLEDNASGRRLEHRPAPQRTPPAYGRLAAETSRRLRQVRPRDLGPRARDEVRGHARHAGHEVPVRLRSGVASFLEGTTTPITGSPSRLRARSPRRSDGEKQLATGTDITELDGSTVEAWLAETFGAGGDDDDSEITVSAVWHGFNTDAKECLLAACATSARVCRFSLIGPAKREYGGPEAVIDYVKSRGAAPARRTRRDYWTRRSRGDAAAADLPRGGSRPRRGTVGLDRGAAADRGSSDDADSVNGRGSSDDAASQARARSSSATTSRTSRARARTSAS